MVNNPVKPKWFGYTMATTCLFRMLIVFQTSNKRNPFRKFYNRDIIRQQLSKESSNKSYYKSIFTSQVFGNAKKARLIKALRTQ